jgi:hypothetical protein
VKERERVREREEGRESGRDGEREERQLHMDCNRGNIM